MYVCTYIYIYICVIQNPANPFRRGPAAHPEAHLAAAASETLIIIIIIIIIVIIIVINLYISLSLYIYIYIYIFLVVRNPVVTPQVSVTRGGLRLALRTLSHPPASVPQLNGFRHSAKGGAVETGCSDLLYNTTPIHCTPLTLHPPVMNTQV